MNLDSLIKLVARLAVERLRAEQCAQDPAPANDDKQQTETRSGNGNSID